MKSACIAQSIESWRWNRLGPGSNPAQPRDNKINDRETDQPNQMAKALSSSLRILKMSNKFIFLATTMFFSSLLWSSTGLWSIIGLSARGLSSWLYTWIDDTHGYYWNSYTKLGVLFWAILLLWVLFVLYPDISGTADKLMSKCDLFKHLFIRIWFLFYSNYIYSNSL